MTMPGNLPLVAAAILGAILVLEVSYGPGARIPEALTDGSAPALSERGDAALPLPSEYKYFVSRPLFNRTRLPAANRGGAAGAGSEAASLPFSLAGIITTDGRRLALIQASGNREILHIEEGGSVAGWTIDEIYPDHVLFQRGTRSVAVAVREKAAATPRRRPKPQRGATQIDQ